MKYSFAPLRDERCEILILGSLPGEESLRMQQYYAHPRNSFWKIMFEILGEKYTDDYREKCRMMLKHHIALWDVVYSGERQGSLDSNIKNMSSNDMSSFLAKYPNIKKILLNGKKAYSVFVKNVPECTAQVICLPSTSPANAAVKYREKLERWSRAVLSSRPDENR